jgi:hypothetical protein
MLLMNVSLLIAAEAYFFSLDRKEAKDQNRKKLPPTGHYLWPAFLSGHRSFDMEYACTVSEATSACPYKPNATQNCGLA